MKKIVRIAFLLLVALSLLPLAAEAGSFSMYGNDDQEITAGIGIQGWFSSADAKWQTSFPVFTNTGAPAGRVESQLDFRKIDSPVTIITGGAKINPRFSFDVLLGFGSIAEGRGMDTDRFLPSSGGGLDFSQSVSSIDGDVRLWGINVYYNNNRFGETKHGPWGMVLGFLHYEDNLVMKNGIQTTTAPFAGFNTPLGPFPGLNSTFDFSWNALKVGVTRKAPLMKQLSYSGMLSIYPYVMYEGEGFWNLRTTGPDAFRAQSPNFVQKSTTGYGYEATLALLYDVSVNVELSAGYRYFFLYANNGVDTVYFADGSSADSTLDWATVTRHGAYAEVLFKF